jgi:uncharacterized protein YggE
MKNLRVFFMMLGSFGLQAQQTSQQLPMVTVSGEGIIKVIPDEVTIRARTEHEGDDPVKVKRQNDQVVNAVIKYLKKQGIPEKDIQTDYMRLNKKYQRKEEKPIYVANQAISITVRNLKNYAEIMSGLLDTGINRIDGVSFSSSKIEDHRAEARKKAVLDARQKAATYASTLEQSIGKALFISEIDTGNNRPMYEVREMKMSMDDPGQETIAPGEMEVSAKINIGFLLN